jgi:hypothetical protein
MPKFFFSCEGYNNFADETGTELPDLATARQEAVRLAGQLMDDHPREISEASRWRVIVRSDVGETLFAIQFSFEINAADGTQGST